MKQQFIKKNKFPMKYLVKHLGIYMELAYGHKRDFSQNTALNALFGFRNKNFHNFNLHNAILIARKINILRRKFYLNWTNFRILYTKFMSRTIQNI